MRDMWRGTAELMGSGVAVAAAYPIRGMRVDDEIGEKVEFDIQEPVEAPGFLGAKELKQRIELRVTAEENRVEDAAGETVREIADAVSFGTGRRVEVSLGFLTNAPPGATEGPYRTIIPLKRVPVPQPPAGVSEDFLAGVAAALGDIKNDRGRRISRAMRWLRRACLAGDEVEEFSCLAFGFEALTRLLPEPSSPLPKVKKKKGKKIAEKPSTSEKLRHFAVDLLGISEEDWKRAGTLRHQLFHGGITETPETRADLAFAIPAVRLALTAAIKQLLGLPREAPPPLQRPGPVVGRLQVIAPMFTPASEAGGSRTPKWDDNRE